MTNTRKAILWATAVLLIALASAAGLTSKSTATAMLLVLPVIAALTLKSGRRSGRCTSLCNGSNA